MNDPSIVLLGCVYVSILEVKHTENEFFVVIYTCHLTFIWGYSELFMIFLPTLMPGKTKKGLELAEMNFFPLQTAQLPQSVHPIQTMWHISSSLP